MDDCETRAAVRAIDERIAVTAIRWIEQFAQTIVARGEVGWHMNDRVAIRLGLDDLELLVTLFGEDLFLNVRDHRLLRRFVG